MDSEQRGGVAAEAAPQDEVVWSRAWEWPAWMRPALPARRGWRPGAGTLAVVLLVFFVPAAIGGLGNLGLDLDLIRRASDQGAYGTYLGVPQWLRLFYTAQVVLAFASLGAVVAALLLPWWRRVGAGLLVPALLAVVAGEVMVLMAYLQDLQAPTATRAQMVADIVSHLVLLGLVVLLLLPRREAVLPPVEASFAPPAP